MSGLTRTVVASSSESVREFFKRDFDYTDEDVQREPSRLHGLDARPCVAVMIETHVFNSFLRGSSQERRLHDRAIDRRTGRPLFFYRRHHGWFSSDKREEQGFGRRARMLDIWKRGGYILCIAELILFQQYVSQWAFGNWKYLLRVDILNCMALAIAVSGIVALGPRQASWPRAFSGRDYRGIGSSRLCSRLNHAPTLLRDYLIPVRIASRFFRSGVCAVRNGCRFVLRRPRASLPTAMT